MISYCQCKLTSNALRGEITLIQDNQYHICMYFFFFIFIVLFQNHCRFHNQYSSDLWITKLIEEWDNEEILQRIVYLFSFLLWLCIPYPNFHILYHFPPWHVSITCIWHESDNLVLLTFLIKDAIIIACIFYTIYIESYMIWFWYDGNNENNCVCDVFLLHNISIHQKTPIQEIL